MSEMESEVREYLVKIAVSISAVLLWMLLNVTIGIGFNYAFFTGRPSMANYIYYIGLLATLFLLVRYLLKKWK